MASDRDDELNKCIGKALDMTFKQDSIGCTVVSEKRNLNGYGIQPDMQVIFSEYDVICLEPTWRTTGVKDGEKRAQNTLTTGHIQKYVLEKAIEYVKVVGL